MIKALLAMRGRLIRLSLSRTLGRGRAEASARAVRRPLRRNNGTHVIRAHRQSRVPHLARAQTVPNPGLAGEGAAVVAYDIRCSPARQPVRAVHSASLTRASPRRSCQARAASACDVVA